MGSYDREWWERYMKLYMKYLYIYIITCENKEKENKKQKYKKGNKKIHILYIGTGIRLSLGWRGVTEIYSLYYKLYVLYIILYTSYINITQAKSIGKELWRYGETLWKLVYPWRT